MTGTTLRHPGDLFPVLVVNLPGGRTLQLPDDLAGRFGVVLFSRGARCPYCNAQLSAFQRVAALDDDLIDDPAYQPEGGRLPATLAGVPQRPVLAPPAAPPALITTCRAPAAGLVWPSGGHRTSTTVRATAKTQLSRQGVPHGTATA